MLRPGFMRMTADEFVVWNETQEERYELVDGYVVKMMTGASGGHALVTSNVLSALKPQARRTGCRTLASDYGVRTSEAQVRYPDVVVTCGPFDPKSLAAENPVLVVEVLSPSTSTIDTIEKFEEYKRVSSIQYILLVHPAVLDVTVYERSSDGAVTHTQYWTLEDVVDLSKIGAKLALSSIYEDLEPEQRRLRLVDR